MMPFTQAPTRQQLAVLCNGDERLLRAFDSLFKKVNLTLSIQVVFAINSSGELINKLSPVMYDGVLETGHIAFTKADASSGPRSKFLGITQEVAVNDQLCPIVNFGEIAPLDSTGPDREIWNDGDLLYLNTKIPGLLTNIRPGSGFILPMARVLKADSAAGSIFVNNTFSEGDF